ncbi:autotransporter outer membrane beta-barrel domain-containing protein [Neptuniibacter halophilus]|uniref:autotransporter family protein n=1 Tax=Neptuniibacter halophilus TaxID=651666 RepID=UPI002572D637|nr:autotransporter outer membrane beta-barrel domain-containing protein [Neptuniibacter halophilus]
MKNSSRSFHKSPAFKRTALSIAVMLNCSAALAAPAPITLSGDYIKIGTNHYGTLGSIGNTSPGILYDNSGTGTFNTAYDYLTPGTPFEGFYIRSTESSTTYNTGANNSGGLLAGLSYSSFTDTSSGTTNSVSWTGSYDPGSGKLFDITNDVSFEDGDKIVKVVTTITATKDLSDLYFLRVTDPDARAEPGDSTATTNIRGNDSVDGTNLVYAEALSSKYIIGYYSNAASGVNTGVSSAWSTDPTYYYAGNTSGDGDYTIGMAFYDDSVLTGDTVVFTYYYIFGSDISAAVEAVGGLSVLNSATLESNSPAFGAANVIDNNASLLSVFTGAGLSGDQEISDAASQTLPLLTGSSTIATTAALNGINRVIQARIDSNLGLSSGDGFIRDQYIWVKPFGSWVDQDNRDGIAGFDANTYGLAAGFDGLIHDNYRLGLAFAYAESDVDSKSSVAPQHLETEVYQLVGYGSYSLDAQTDINFQVDVGHNSNKGKRTIAFTSTVADADYNSLSAHAGIGIGRTLEINESTSFTPSIRADYTWIKDDSYSETGAGVLNLNVDQRSTRELLIGLHGKFANQLNKNTALTANLGVSYDLHNGPSSITSSFAGAPSASFVTYGIDPNPWRAHAGFGFVYALENGTEINARYDADYQNDFLNQTASVKFRWMF